MVDIEELSASSSTPMKRTPLPPDSMTMVPRDPRRTTENKSDFSSFAWNHKDGGKYHARNMASHSSVPSFQQNHKTPPQQQPLWNSTAMDLSSSSSSSSSSSCSSSSCSSSSCSSNGNMDNDDESSVTSPTKLSLDKEIYKDRKTKVVERVSTSNTVTSTFKHHTNNQHGMKPRSISLQLQKEEQKEETTCGRHNGDRKKDSSIQKILSKDSSLPVLTPTKTSSSASLRRRNIAVGSKESNEPVILSKNADMNHEQPWNDDDDDDDNHDEESPFTFEDYETDLLPIPPQKDEEIELSPTPLPSSPRPFSSSSSSSSSLLTPQPSPSKKKMSFKQVSTTAASSVNTTTQFMVDLTKTNQDESIPETQGHMSTSSKPAVMTKNPYLAPRHTKPNTHNATSVSHHSKSESRQQGYENNKELKGRSNDTLVKSSSSGASQAHPTGMDANNISPDAQDDHSNRQEEDTTICSSKRHPEVHPHQLGESILLPSPQQQHLQSDPTLNILTLQNRPNNLRRKIPLQQVFPNPIIRRLWQGSKFQELNAMQSELAHKVVESDDNIVVSAPTGAGKTTIFEMAMTRIFQGTNSRTNGTSISCPVSNQKKILYMAPSKALCEERYRDWSRRFTNMKLGIRCSLITGDDDRSDSDDGSNNPFQKAASSHVILTTPEKWDSLTRRWTEHFFLFGSVKLVLMDEVHLLGDSSRGCCLESVICRMKTIQRTTMVANVTSSQIQSSASFSQTTPEAFASNMRIVAVSATLPNFLDVAAFLDANEAFSFDSSYRPVPLTTHVLGFGYIGGSHHANNKSSGSSNQFLFGKNLAREVPNIIRKYSKGRPTIVFCHTKRETETLAVELSAASGIGSSSNNKGRTEVAGRTKVTALQRCILRGVAYHHAGLDVNDRRTIEQAFASGKIMCLTATSTLAMGINLPAHLVIVKGTQTWRGTGAGHQDIDAGTLLQMIGRAGRPGFDTSGTAVIMTDNASKRRYEKLSSGLESVESQLKSSNKLAEVLNVEISQRVVSNIESAVNWMKGTFFYQCAKRNPSRYVDCGNDQSNLDDSLKALCKRSLQQLSQNQIILLDGDEVSPLNASSIMSQHLVDFPSFQKIVALPHDATMVQILQTLSAFDGLHRPVRRSEKKLLNEVHKMIKYKLEGGPPSKIRVQTPEQKAFVLLQASIGQHYLEDYTLRQELSSMVDNATRMLNAIEEFSTEGSKHGQVALQSLRLRRSLTTSLWGAHDGVLNQIRGIGASCTAKLKFNGIANFPDVLQSSPDAINRASARQPPFGQELQGAVSRILQSTLTMAANIEYTQSPSKTPKEIVCTFEKLNLDGSFLDIQNKSNSPNYGGIVTYTLAVYTDRAGGSLLFLQNICSPGEYRIPCPSHFGKVYIHATSNLVGLDEVLVLDGNDEVEQNAFTSPLPLPSSKKTKNSSKSSPNEEKAKRHLEFQNSVDGVSDLRLNNNRPLSTTKNATKATTPPNQNRGYSNSLNRQPFFRPSQFSNQTGTKNNRPTNHVTPSPKFGSSTSASIPRMGQHGTTTNRTPSRFSSANRNDRGRNQMLPSSNRKRDFHQTAWTKEKKEQGALQQRAFRNKKDNPFAQFKYDPNSAESSLELNATRSVTEQSIESSIIPPEAYSALREANAAAREQYQNQMTPMKNGLSRFKSGGTHKKKRFFRNQNQPEQQLLHMKATELQSYQQTSLAANHPIPPNQDYYQTSQCAPSAEQFNLPMNHSDMGIDGITRGPETSQRRHFSRVENQQQPFAARQACSSGSTSWESEGTYNDWTNNGTIQNQSHEQQLYSDGMPDEIAISSQTRNEFNDAPVDIWSPPPIHGVNGACTGIFQRESFPQKSEQMPDMECNTMNFQDASEWPPEVPTYNPSIEIVPPFLSNHAPQQGSYVMEATNFGKENSPRSLFLPKPTQDQTFVVQNEDCNQDDDKLLEEAFF